MEIKIEERKDKFIRSTDQSRPAVSQQVSPASLLLKVSPGDEHGGRWRIESDCEAKLWLKYPYPPWHMQRRKEKREPKGWD